MEVAKFSPPTSNSPWNGSNIYCVNQLTDYNGAVETDTEGKDVPQFKFNFRFVDAYETVDLLFFRLSGGNTRVGHFAAMAAPFVMFFAAWFVVTKYL